MSKNLSAILLPIHDYYPRPKQSLSEGLERYFERIIDIVKASFRSRAGLKKYFLQPEARSQLLEIDELSNQDFFQGQCQLLNSISLFHF